MKSEIAEKILQETEEGYDLIAGKFSETRKHFWRGLEFIGDYAKDGDKVLDFGCGNGRLLELFRDKNIDYQGVDISKKLVAAAQEKYLHPVKSTSSGEICEAEVQRSNFTGQGSAKQFNRASFTKIDPSQTTLAFTDDYFNTVYSIAVFHHFPFQKYREDMARELYRTTKDGGHIIITVWNLYQKRYIVTIMENWINKIFGKSKLDWNDCYIPFTDNAGNKFQRFHHAFLKCELKKLFKKAGFEIERCEIVGGRNIILIAKKKG